MLRAPVRPTHLVSLPRAADLSLPSRTSAAATPRPTRILGLAVFGLALFLLGQAIGVLQEAPVRSAVYATLAQNLESTGLDLARPAHEVAFPERPSAVALRDLAFEWFAVRPEARAWLQDLPVDYETNVTWGGRYRLDTRSVALAQPYLHIVLHEYAHANLHHKSFLDKGQTLLAMARLLLDGDPRHQQARTVLEGVLADGAKTMRQGRSYSLLHESYAYLAQWSGGNLSALPDYLQFAYADYLTPGTNMWLQWQDQQAGMDK